MGHGRNEKRERHWNLFMGMSGITKEELMDAAEPMFGGFQEHWRKNGKWVDDAGFKRWIENGCKTAATIEEIIDANPFASIRCYVVDWSTGCFYSRIIMEEYIKSTIDFDDWLFRAKTLEAKNPKGTIFPVIAFSYDTPIRHPNGRKKDNDLVLIKKKRQYLTRIDPDGKSSYWSYNKKDATSYLYTEAVDMLKRYRAHLDGAQVVSNKVKKTPNNLVIRISGTDYGTFYVLKLSRTGFKYIRDINQAKHYSTAAAAKKAVPRIESICHLHSGLSKATVEVIADENYSK